MINWGRWAVVVPVIAIFLCFISMIFAFADHDFGKGVILAILMAVNAWSSYVIWKNTDA